MTHRNLMTTLSVLLAGLWLAGCAGTAKTDASRVESDFGKSVKQMVEAQIYDPEAAKNPPEEPPMGLDGVQAEAVLEKNRTQVGDPNTVNDDVRIRINR